jgi:DNA-binding transcriptional ArsR family regulator
MADMLATGPMDAAQLRALAHPLRLQLLEFLRVEGPATASQLARRPGESTST